MPRKTPAEQHQADEAARGFNEAAARCRGKPQVAEAVNAGWDRFNEAAARCRGKPTTCRHGGLPAVPASMRPRPDAAENPASRRDHVPGILRASMRPRPDAAENHRRADPRPHAGTAASMRPRPDAAENRLGRMARARRGHAGFNEAAARCRGKPHAAQGGVPLVSSASMRPRPDAAENRRLDEKAGTNTAAGFNEAAARCRGKPRRRATPRERPPRLQ